MDKGIEFLVVGTVRNVEKTIERDIERFHNIFSGIGIFRILLVESDSNDSTVNLLQILTRKFDYFEFMTLGSLEEVIPNRINRLQFCRNKYLEVFRNESKFNSVKFLVVADFDGINNRISKSSLEKALNRNQDWNVLFANSSRRYYDILALRHSIWCPENALLQAELLTHEFGIEKARQFCIYDRMIQIPQELDLIPVISAFGGLAIYRTHCLSNFDYSPNGDDQNSDIDHVILNKKIYKSFGGLYIDPSLINTGWNEHNLMVIKFLRKINYIARKYNFFVLRRILKYLHNAAIK